MVIIKTWDNCSGNKYLLYGMRWPHRLCCHNWAFSLLPCLQCKEEFLLSLSSLVLCMLPYDLYRAFKKRFTVVQLRKFKMMGFFSAYLSASFSHNSYQETLCLPLYTTDWLKEVKQLYDSPYYNLFSTIIWPFSRKILCFSE